MNLFKGKESQNNIVNILQTMHVDCIYNSFQFLGTYLNVNLHSIGDHDKMAHISIELQQKKNHKSSHLTQNFVKKEKHTHICPDFAKNSKLQNKDIEALYILSMLTWAIPLLHSTTQGSWCANPYSLIQKDCLLSSYCPF
jgi:hypothetical protein